MEQHDKVSSYCLSFSNLVDVKVKDLAPSDYVFCGKGELSVRVCLFFFTARQQHKRNFMFLIQIVIAYRTQG